MNSGDGSVLALTSGLAEGRIEALVDGEVEPDGGGLGNSDAEADASGDAAGGSWIGDAEAFALGAGTPPAILGPFYRFDAASAGRGPVA